MKLLIISASQRKLSQSAKVAQYFAESVSGYEEIVHLELCQYQLPYWDGEQSSKLSQATDWPMIYKHIQASDAFIAITPEWGGMATPLLKNFLLMCASQDTAHKPILLTSISNGVSGVFPIAELRMNAFRNNKLVVIADHLVIRNVEEVLNPISVSNSKISTRDSSIRHRIGYTLHTLQKYSKHFKALRAEFLSQPYDNEELYPYGM